jgi:hypothetical protein
LRQWIAAATGFALAIHLVLGAVVIGHFAPSQADAATDVFVICHGAGDNSAPNQNAPAGDPSRQSHCVLCTLTNAACAVLPLVTAIATFDASQFLQRFTLRDSQVIQFASLTGEYPRGPPTHAHVAG